MPGWLKKIWTTLGAVEAMLREPFLFHLLVATDNTIRGLHTRIGEGFKQVWYGAHQIWWGGKWLGFETAVTFTHILRIKFPALWRYAAWLHKWAQTQFAWERKQRIAGDRTERRHADNAVAALLKWVVVRVLRVLIALGIKITWYIVNRIAPMWDLLTHPLKLARLLLAALITVFELEVKSLAKPMGRFFFALIIHNLRWFALLLEDIIVSVL